MIKSTRLVTLFFILVVIISCTYYYYHYLSRENFTDNLTFSSTDNWGKNEKKALHNITALGKRLLSNMPTIPFPRNQSSETDDEIKNIKKKRYFLTEDRQQDIEDEIMLKGIFRKFKMTPTESNSIVKIFQSEIDSIIMQLKNKYNRVRPYKLDETIIPSIDPPQHPSYPSGHATQAYFIANVLSEKYPSRRTHYMNVAETIAVNREYAGVHYHSDTKFGKIVADTLFQYFSGDKNPLKYNDK